MLIARQTNPVVRATRGRASSSGVRPQTHFPGHESELMDRPARCECRESEVPDPQNPAANIPRWTVWCEFERNRTRSFMDIGLPCEAEPVPR